MVVSPTKARWLSWQRDTLASSEELWVTAVRSREQTSFISRRGGQEVLWDLIAPEQRTPPISYHVPKTMGAQASPKVIPGILSALLDLWSPLLACPISLCHCSSPILTYGMVL